MDVGASVTSSGLHEASNDAINHIKLIMINLDFFIIDYPKILTNRLQLLTIIYEFDLLVSPEMRFVFYNPVVSDTEAGQDIKDDR